MGIHIGLHSITKVVQLGFLVVALFFTSCSEGGKESVTDEVSIDYRSHRLDLDMYTVSQAYQNNPRPDSSILYKQYFAVHRDFLVDWIFYGEDSLATDSVLTVFMAEFLSDPNAAALFSDIEKRFPPSGEDPFAGMENLLLHLKYYFPSHPTPVLFTFADGFPGTFQAGLEHLFISRRYIGVGIHYLMGKSYRFYPPDMPQYLRRRCNPEHLPSLVAHQYADFFIPPPPVESNPVLLDHIVYHGLKMYLVDKLLGPEVPDSIKLFYTDQQMLWANTYEARAYKEMIGDLYNFDAALIRRYTGDSPFTSHLARGSAPRLGQFIGWKIVQNYAEKHPEESVAELIARTDYKAIFQRSGYRPE